MINKSEFDERLDNGSLVDFLEGRTSNRDKYDAISKIADEAKNVQSSLEDSDNISADEITAGATKMADILRGMFGESINVMGPENLLQKIINDDARCRMDDTMEYEEIDVNSYVELLEYLQDSNSHLYYVTSGMVFNIMDDEEWNMLVPEAQPLHVRVLDNTFNSTDDDEIFNEIKSNI